MNAFNGWWERRGSRIHKLSISMNKPGGKSYQEGTKDGFKACLEWVLTWEIDIETIEIIKRELEEL